MEDENNSLENSVLSTHEEGGGEERLAISVLEQQEIENLIGYKFNTPRLLQQAFIHTSCKENSESYERLEYMGDSVLNLMIAREHFFLYPDYPPGKLTVLRSANVDTEKLARATVKLNLHKFLRHNKPLLQAQIEDFCQALLEYPTHSAGLVYSPKDLADLFESLVGSIFLDSNSSLETTWQIVKKLLEPMVTNETLRAHPVSQLNEYCQKNGLDVNYKYLKWQETGEVKVYVNEECVGSGKCPPKRLIAVNRAAHDAYNRIFNRIAARPN